VKGKHIETQNTQYVSTNCEDRRGYVAGATPDCPIDSITFIIMMKRE
jgi:hypothetical protein